MTIVATAHNGHAAGVLAIFIDGPHLPSSLPLSAITSIMCLAVFSTLANVLYFRLLERQAQPIPRWWVSSCP